MKTRRERPMKRIQASVGLVGTTAAFGEASPWNTMLTGSLIATIPIAILIFNSQRCFVQGIATSGSKG